MHMYGCAWSGPVCQEQICSNGTPELSSAIRLSKEWTQTHQNVLRNLLLGKEIAEVLGHIRIWCLSPGENSTTCQMTLREKLR